MRCLRARATQGYKCRARRRASSLSARRLQSRGPQSLDSVPRAGKRHGQDVAVLGTGRTRRAHRLHAIQAPSAGRDIVPPTIAAPALARRESHTGCRARRRARPSGRLASGYSNVFRLPAMPIVCGAHRVAATIRCEVIKPSHSERPRSSASLSPHGRAKNPRRCSTSNEKSAL